MGGGKKEPGYEASMAIGSLVYLLYITARVYTFDTSHIKTHETFETKLPNISCKKLIKAYMSAGYNIYVYNFGENAILIYTRVPLQSSNATLVSVIRITILSRVSDGLLRLKHDLFLYWFPGIRRLEEVTRVIYHPSTT